ncbi:MAG TPA: hypothetical protein VM328_06095 [Fimbriimonadaceae bacterium]|nr:hypothetical protein [Fimbriimonadaceae bacterium]
MMKRIQAVFLAAAAAFVVAGCGSSEADPDVPVMKEGDQLPPGVQGPANMQTPGGGGPGAGGAEPPVSQ